MGITNIADLRRYYTKGELNENDLPDNPVLFLEAWVEQALENEITEPNAMSLATTDNEGKPSVRTVLLKGVEVDSITFFTNYESEKADQLNQVPYASCCFWWPELERQVRLSGPVEKLPPEMSREYFSTRPRESQIGAWASTQSRSVKNREELEKRYKKYERKFEGTEVPMPEYWGGYRIIIEEIEFWQGRKGRLHDRFRYQKEKGTWKKVRLSP